MFCISEHLIIDLICTHEQLYKSIWCTHWIDWFRIIAINFHTVYIMSRIAMLAFNWKQKADKILPLYNLSNNYYYSFLTKTRFPDYDQVCPIRWCTPTSNFMTKIWSNRWVYHFHYLQRWVLISGFGWPSLSSCDGAEHRAEGCGDAARGTCPPSSTHSRVCI